MTSNACPRAEFDNLQCMNFRALVITLNITSHVPCGVCERIVTIHVTYIHIRLQQLHIYYIVLSHLPASAAFVLFEGTFVYNYYNRLLYQNYT